MALIENLSASVFENGNNGGGIIIRLAAGTLSQEKTLTKVKEDLKERKKPLVGEILRSPLPNILEILLR